MILLVPRVQFATTWEVPVSVKLMLMDDVAIDVNLDTMDSDPKDADVSLYY